MQGSFNEVLHARRGFGSTIFHRCAEVRLERFALRRRLLPGRKITSRRLAMWRKYSVGRNSPLRSNYCAVFRFHGRIDLGLASLSFHGPNASRSITSGVESSCRSRSVKSVTKIERPIGDNLKIAADHFSDTRFSAAGPAVTQNRGLIHGISRHSGAGGDSQCFFQGEKVSSSMGLKQEHFGWFELAGARIDRVAEYCERRHS